MSRPGLHTAFSKHQFLEKPERKHDAGPDLQGAPDRPDEEQKEIEESNLGFEMLDQESAHDPCHGSRSADAWHRHVWCKNSMK